MVLGISDQEVIYDENGDINQDHVLDDYQKNPKGLAPGDVVVVAAKGLKFYHVRKYKVSSHLLAICFHLTIRSLHRLELVLTNVFKLSGSRGNGSDFEWLTQSKQ